MVCCCVVCLSWRIKDIIYGEEEWLIGSLLATKPKKIVLHRGTIPTTPYQVFEDVEGIAGDSDVFDFARLFQLEQSGDSVGEKLLIGSAELNVVKLDYVQVFDTQANERLFYRLHRLFCVPER